MASFVARTVERSGGQLPAAGDQGFGDIAGNVHAERINQLAAAGIVQGTAAGTYAPGSPVTRAQMATFLVRAFEYRTDPALRHGGDHRSPPGARPGPGDPAG